MRSLIGHTNFVLVYSVIWIGRGMLLSIPVMSLILLFRKTLFRRNAFAKGFLWSLLLLVPFMGKLKFFYENRTGVRLSWWWQALCAGHPWICWLYALGMLLMGVFLCLRKHRLKRFVKGLKQVEHISGFDIRICELTVTPFAVGLLHPVVVLPEIFLKEYTKEELEIIVLHEKTHIRLGHLWCYFLWDCLRVLFWMNPLMTIGIKYMRIDLEEICDRVCIQKQQGEAIAYGMLILKTARRLNLKDKQRSYRVGMSTFAGEQEFGVMKQRMLWIAKYAPYRESRLCVAALMIACMFLAALFGIKKVSYPRYTEIQQVSISTVDWDTQMLLFTDRQTFQNAFWCEDGILYIDWKEMEPLLQENGIEVEEFFLGFGGFMKLPGVGGGCNAIYVERYSPKPADGIEAIPYFDNEKLPIMQFYRYIY